VKDTVRKFELSIPVLVQEQRQTQASAVQQKPLTRSTYDQAWVHSGLKILSQEGGRDGIKDFVAPGRRVRSSNRHASYHIIVQADSHLAPAQLPNLHGGQGCKFAQDSSPSSHGYLHGHTFTRGAS
jgi:hypothetical protein